MADERGIPVTHPDGTVTYIRPGGGEVGADMGGSIQEVAEGIVRTATNVYEEVTGIREAEEATAEANRLAAELAREEALALSTERAELLTRSRLTSIASAKLKRIKFAESLLIGEGSTSATKQVSGSDVEPYVPNSIPNLIGSDEAGNAIPSVL